MQKKKLRLNIAKTKKSLSCKKYDYSKVGNGWWVLGVDGEEVYNN